MTVNEYLSPALCFLALRGLCARHFDARRITAACCTAARYVAHRERTSWFTRGTTANQPQVPVLMIDGLNVVQSQAIVRHVARQAGRMGTSPAEQALADMARRGSVVMRSIDVVHALTQRRSHEPAARLSAERLLAQAAEGASDFRRGLLSLPFGGSKCDGHTFLAPSFPHDAQARPAASPPLSKPHC